MIKCKFISDRNEIADACSVGRDNYLHNYGKMNEWYSNPQMIECMVMATYESEVVGMCVIAKQVEDTWNRIKVNAGFYVHSGYRRRGIGTEMGRVLTANYSGPAYCWIESQKDFVRKDFFAKALSSNAKIGHTMEAEIKCR